MSRNERRFHARYACALPVEVWAPHDGDWRCIESTQMLDVSGGGARLITHHPEAYEVGQSVDLHILRPDRGALDCPAHVVWVGAEQGGRATVSLAMQYVFDDEQLAALMRLD